MVEMLDPKPTDTVCDPACGTGGFLISVMLYLYEKYSTAALVETDAEGNKHYPGDLLEASGFRERRRLCSKTWVRTRRASVR
jgi:type I restriction enzyme M protein